MKRGYVALKFIKVHYGGNVDARPTLKSNVIELSLSSLREA